jgi:hypothetical protein
LLLVVSTEVEKPSEAAAAADSEIVLPDDRLTCPVKVLTAVPLAAAVASVSVPENAETTVVAPVVVPVFATA